MAAEQHPGSTDELDPAAPGTASEAAAGEIEAANLGLDGRGDLPPGESVELPTGEEGVEGPPPTLDIDVSKAEAFLQACLTSTPRVAYGLGAKIRAGQVPGRDFRAVDCSGFVREAIRRSTTLGNGFPDGSVVQHDWIKARGFAKVDRSSGAQRDGAVRIAFLAPQDAPSRIGHVVLLHDGKTLESHGGVGPNSRPWTGSGWQAKASLYLLDPYRLRFAAFDFVDSASLFVRGESCKPRPLFGSMTTICRVRTLTSTPKRLALIRPRRTIRTFWRRHEIGERQKP